MKINLQIFTLLKLYSKFEILTYKYIFKLNLFMISIFWIPYFRYFMRNIF